MFLDINASRSSAKYQQNVAKIYRARSYINELKALIEGGYCYDFAKKGYETSSFEKIDIEERRKLLTIFFPFKTKEKAIAKSVVRQMEKQRYFKSFTYGSKKGLKGICRDSSHDETIAKVLKMLQYLIGQNEDPFTNLKNHAASDYEVAKICLIVCLHCGVKFPLNNYDGFANENSEKSLELKTSVID